MGMIDNLKTAVGLVAKVRDAELKLPLHQALLDVQGEALKLQQEVAELREKLNDKARIAELECKLFYARHAYWRKDETINSAYCPVCWDTKRQLVRLVNLSDGFGHCHPCDCTLESVYKGQRPNEGDEASPPSSAPQCYSF